LQIYDDGISLRYEASQSSKEAPVQRRLSHHLAGAFAPTLNVAADPVSDLRSISVLKDVDLSKLSGENVTAAGAEAKQYSGGASGGAGSVPGPVLTFWSQVLPERARNFASGYWASSDRQR
jgi:hypothetical protein